MASSKIGADWLPKAAGTANGAGCAANKRAQPVNASAPQATPPFKTLPKYSTYWLLTVRAPKSSDKRSTARLGSFFSRATKILTPRPRLSHPNTSPSASRIGLMVTRHVARRRSLRRRGPLRRGRLTAKAPRSPSAQVVDDDEKHRRARGKFEGWHCESQRDFCASTAPESIHVVKITNVCHEALNPRSFTSSLFGASRGLGRPGSLAILAPWRLNQGAFARRAVIVLRAVAASNRDD